MNNIPKLKVDKINGVNGVIVLEETPGRIFAIVNRDFTNLTPIVVEAFNNHKQTESLCEAVADIAFLAGENKYYSGNSRQDMADFIEWAKEFEELNDGVEWGVNSGIDYIDAITEFTFMKMEKLN